MAVAMLLFGAVAISFGPQEVRARRQPVALRARSPAAFSWIDVAVDTGLSPVSNGLDGWTPGPFAGMEIQAPFPPGRAMLGFQIGSWESARPDLPDFRSAFLFAGFRGGSPADAQVRLSAGIRMGNFFMAFESDQVAGNRNESELAVAPEVEIRIRISRALDLRLESSTIRVFTLPRLTIFNAGAGLSWRFPAPDGLKRVME